MSPPQVVGRPGEPSLAPAIASTRVGEHGRRFNPRSVLVEIGRALAIVNDDTRTHQVRVDDPRFSFASGAQEPGETVSLTFPQAGHYAVTCGIHPEMRLDVTVSAP
jgi:cytochrome c peroxidase